MMIFGAAGVIMTAGTVVTGGQRQEPAQAPSASTWIC